MKGWQFKKLNDLCEFRNGLWKGKNPPYQTVGVIRNTNFTKDGFLDDSNIAYLEVEIKQYSTRKLYAGDLILEKSGGGPKQPVGRVILFDEEKGEFSFSNFTSIIRVRDRSTLLPKYLHKVLHFFYLSGVTESMQKNSTNIRNLQLKEYKEIEVPVPPIAEQKRIVAIVDEVFEGIDSAIANAEKNLANARELFESYLKAIFTRKGDDWVEKTVGEISKHSLGKMLDKRKNIGEFKPYLRNLNVRWFEFDLSDLLEMRFEEKERDKYTAIKGDVMICEGGYPGRSAIWEEDEPIYFQKAIHRVRFENPAHSKWFLYFIYLCDCNGDLREYFTGAGIQHFTGQSLHRFKLPVPPTSQTEKLTEIFDELREETQRLEAIYQRKLAALNELKQSILQKAFSGELTADVGVRAVEGAKEAMAA